MISTAVMSAYCARLKASFTGGIRRRTAPTSRPANTARKACVPVAKTSARVSGTSVSVNACVARRNCISIGQRSVTMTMRPRAHQAISGLWIASAWRMKRRYSATATAPMPPLSHHTGSMERSFRAACPGVVATDTPRRSTVARVHCALAHCARVHCARVH